MGKTRIWGRLKYGEDLNPGKRLFFSNSKFFLFFSIPNFFWTTVINFSSSSYSAVQNPEKIQKPDYDRNLRKICLFSPSLTQVAFFFFYSFIQNRKRPNSWEEFWEKVYFFSLLLLISRSTVTSFYFSYSNSNFFFSLSE